jgi:hypothetical protein
MDAFGIGMRAAQNLPPRQLELISGFKNLQATLQEMAELERFWSKQAGVSSLSGSAKYRRCMRLGELSNLSAHLSKKELEFV